MSDNNLKGRILAIDYGSRRMGIAISDPLRIIAQILPTIQVRNVHQVLADLEAIVQEKNVTEIVIGMPLNLKGERGTSAKQVEDFIGRLQSKLQIPIHSWDERWTTVAAHKAMLELGKSPSRHKNKVDQISAQLILQSFLDHLKLNPHN